MFSAPVPRYSKVPPVTADFDKTPITSVELFRCLSQHLNGTTASIGCTIDEGSAQPRGNFVRVYAGNGAVNNKVVSNYDDLHLGHGRHGHGGRSGLGRFFAHGDLRLVILHLIAEKPRHGYEIIKAIEEQVGGAYSPSPGVIYPTLTLLEEIGYQLVAGF